MYCYENPLRDYNLPSTPPDWEKIKRELIKHNRHFTVFGGDPLVIPIEELEDIWKLGKEKWKQNGIQTNGSLITNQHIALFKQYNVHVGFSIDGPHILNDARSAPSGDVNATQVLTEKSNQNLVRCLREGIQTSLIITLHKFNITKDKVYELISWLSTLEMFGLKHVRLHLMERDGNVEHLIPDEDDLFNALKELYEFSKHSKIKFDIFPELIERLKSGDGGTCIFRECDPCNTPSVVGIGVKGESTNCGRVNKEGIDFLKAEDHIPIRTYVLQATPQQDGGCQGCEFWYACTGNCPGTGIEGDWRNRTSHCSILKQLMQHLLDDRDMKLLESSKCKDRPHLDTHGDSYNDVKHLDTDHGDIPHLDKAHHVTPHQDKTYLPPLEVRR
jgi:uncharacterized protein